MYIYFFYCIIYLYKRFWGDSNEYKFYFKKEGINIIGSLNALDINNIANTISTTMAEVFPEHHISQSDLFIDIARLNMYTAEMPNDMAIAKYFTRIIPYILVQIQILQV